MCIKKWRYRVVDSTGIKKRYNRKKLRVIPDEEFYKEREIVRQAYLKGHPDAQRILFFFDEIEVDRLNEQYKKENPNAKPRSGREHGWYLPNDD
ncbi:MAG: hypothetical protein GX666_03480 [Tissierellia bacterium]|nr:hypothetical protein [Tissierellia bacterium]